MKSSLLKSMLCAAILAFAVGCGKDSKSNGNPNNSQYNNLNNSGLTTTNQEALTVATNWFNSTNEGTALQGVVQITRTKYETAAASQNCVEKKFLGIPYQYCTSSSNNQQQGTVVSSSQVNLAFNDGVAVNARGNQELNAIFSGAAGTLVGAYNSGNRSQLDFLAADGKIVSYIIDRSYHSLINPVQKTESSQTGRSDTITTAHRVY